MLKAVPFLLPYIVPLSVVLGARGGGAWTFSTVVLVYVILPAIDFLVGADTRNDHPRKGVKGGTGAHQLILWLWVPANILLLIWALGRVTSGELSVLEIVGLTFSFGIMSGGLTIVFAHELMHRSSRLERALAEFMMATVTYTHFCIEHVAGHHRRVATAEDAVSARLGESFYAFLPRAVLGGVRSAWRLEARRLTRHRLPVIGWRNRMLRFGLELLLLYVIVAVLFGAWGMVFLAVQGYVAFSLLEAVNYLQHYGLERQKLGDGRYEPVQPHHSWNTASAITNWLLVNLGRHSDHHHAAGRHYPLLRHVDDAPQLPLGYSLMVLMAYVPPLWFSVMDPKVGEWRRRYGRAETPDGATAGAGER